MASNEILAHVINLKYMNSLPLYRQENYFSMLDVNLSRQTLSNWIMNTAERAIKPFVIGRKNWLFSNTPKGANASALIYSIIETAKANNLKVEKYLIYLFDRVASLEIMNDESLKDIVSWSSNIPDMLKIKKNK